MEKLLSEELDFVISLFFWQLSTQQRWGFLTSSSITKLLFYRDDDQIIIHYDDDHDDHCLFSGGSGANLDRGSVSRLGREELAG